ncbi:hypothetical protein [Natronorubrum texcoconense]|uniref:Uncharacterized protein n=1 Tax=Natronorubrum texcoconense TaxID=1095776 RepID=A0A1G8YQQ4_9EURY|nr:hypothetical protein [Natronorubrum texcoconense]SDK04415.1 hypothetical protein SAMN04515672_2242 [Natronorubrum texcoconense]
MTNPDREQSRIANNRLAVAVAVGSLLVLSAVGLFYRTGLLDYIVPTHGPAADAAPLYVLMAVALFALIVWSWSRLVSWFD